MTASVHFMYTGQRDPSTPPLASPAQAFAGPPCRARPLALDAGRRIGVARGGRPPEVLVDSAHAALATRELLRRHELRDRPPLGQRAHRLRRLRHQRLHCVHEGELNGKITNGRSAEQAFHV